MKFSLNMLYFIKKQYFKTQLINTEHRTQDTDTGLRTQTHAKNRLHAHSKSTKGVLKIANFAIIVHEVFMSAGQENSLTFKRHRKYTLLPPANVVYKGYVFTGVCLSTGGGVVCVLSQHALQVVSQHALQQVGGGAVGIPACLVEGDLVQAHSQGGS